MIASKRVRNGSDGERAIEARVMRAAIRGRHDHDLIIRQVRMDGFRFDGDHIGRSNEAAVGYGVDVGLVLRIQVIKCADQPIRRAVQIDFVRCGRAGDDVICREDERRVARLIREDENLASFLGDIELRHHAQLCESLLERNGADEGHGGFEALSAGA